MRACCVVSHILRVTHERPAPRKPEDESVDRFFLYQLDLYLTLDARTFADVHGSLATSEGFQPVPK